MSFNPNAKSTDFNRELIPEGPHLARCVRVLEIGNHVSGFPQPDGTVEIPKPKAVIVFSLPDVIMNFGELGDKQAFISNPFGITMSTNEKATMRRYQKALDPNGTAEDLGGFLDKVCQLAVIHKERKDKPPVAVIDSIAPPLPGLAVGAADTELLWLKWDDPDPGVLSQVPQFTRDLIMKADNYQGSKMQEAMAQIDQAPTLGEDEPF